MQATAGESSGEIEFTLPARAEQKERTVRQAVWASTLDIPDGVGGGLGVTCLVARELNVPVGLKPVEWRLLTNREVHDFAGAVQLIHGIAAVGKSRLFSMCSDWWSVEALQLEAQPNRNWR